METQIDRRAILAVIEAVVNTKEHELYQVV
jgi:hypothetical protein